MAESHLFSVGVDNLLLAIRPYGRTETCFPHDLAEVDSRIREAESRQAWFVRLIDRYFGGDPKLAAIEDNIAVFGRFQWKGKERLTCANVQSIVTPSDLEDYYLDPSNPAVYLRLDFDYRTLGDPFSHPLAHIHVEGDRSPRFALDGGNCGNIIVDYFEFLYRNYASRKWLKWVEREWSAEFKRTFQEGDIDPLPTIVTAFTSGSFQILRDYAPDLARIKRTLRRRKDELFGLHMDGSDREILEYPATR
jgi:hypothetical protein